MSSIQVSSMSELNKILHLQVIEILKKVGKEIQGVLRDEVDKAWYNRSGFDFDNSQYERTMQLLESISLSPLEVTGNQYQVKIYYDTSKIIPMYGTDSKPWSRHQSVIDGRSSAEALPYYIEYGNGDSSIYQYEGVHPVQNVIDWERSDKYVLHRFKELLEDKGFKCI